MDKLPFSRRCLSSGFPSEMDNRLASSAATAWKTRDLDRTGGSMLTNPLHASVEPSYYLMRKLLFARRSPEVGGSSHVRPTARLAADHPFSPLHWEFAMWLTEPANGGRMKSSNRMAS
jgi:hypothetical protein